MAYILRIIALLVLAVSSSVTWAVTCQELFAQTAAAREAWKASVTAQGLACGTASTCGGRDIVFDVQVTTSGGVTTETIYYSMKYVSGSYQANHALWDPAKTCTGEVVSTAEKNDTACTNAAILSTLSPKESVDLPSDVSDQEFCLEAAGVSAGQGCRNKFDVTVKFKKPNGSSVTGGQLTPLQGAGSSCALATVPPKPVVNPCPDGQPGTINGVTACLPYPPGTAKTTEEKTAEEKATDGPQGAGSSDTSSSSVTSCVGDKACTTTTTTTTTTNGVPSSSTTTKTQSLAGLCAENPASKQCTGDGKGGAFSGVCGSAPACDGDAVMCAVAAATFATNCALKMPDDTNEQKAYTAGKSKTGDQTANLPNNPAANIGVGADKFNSSNILGAAAGMKDIQISVSGQSITLPFSNVNPWLERLGMILQACTLLACAFIVTGNRQGGKS